MAFMFGFYVYLGIGMPTLEHMTREGRPKNLRAAAHRGTKIPPLPLTLRSTQGKGPVGMTNSKFCHLTTFVNLSDINSHPERNRGIK
jgi:hypothetical protein